MITHASIVPHVTFDVIVNGVTHVAFRRDSSWHGFVRYVDDTGREVIVQETLQERNERAWSNETFEATVVSASETLLGAKPRVEEAKTDVTKN